MTKRPLSFVRSCDPCPLCRRPTVVFLAQTEDGGALYRCASNLCGGIFRGPAPQPFDRLRDEQQREAA